MDSQASFASNLRTWSKLRNLIYIYTFILWYRLESEEAAISSKLLAEAKISTSTWMVEMETVALPTSENPPSTLLTINTSNEEMQGTY